MPLPALRTCWPIVLLILVAAVILGTDLNRALKPETLSAHHDLLRALVAEHRTLALLGYVALYIVVTATSIPGATIMTVLGGFLFGQWLGWAAAVLASTTGALIIFQAARSLLASTLSNRVAPWIERLRSGFSRNAFNYLLALRLIPLFPFFVVNLAPALLGVRTATFVSATAIGILPASFIFVQFGVGLGTILDSNQGFSLDNILNTNMNIALTGLAILALLPAIGKYLFARYTGGQKHHTATPKH